MLKIESVIYTEFGQIHIQDGGYPDCGAEVVEISEVEGHQRMKVSPQIVVVYTDRSGDAEVTVEVLDTEPSVDLAVWDHVVEGSLVVISGQVQVASLSWVPGSYSLQVVPGSYRLRAHSAQLGTAHDTEDEVDVGDDSYLIQMWAAPERVVTVLKQYEFTPRSQAPAWERTCPRSSSFV